MSAKVLVVDDSATVRDLLERRLARKGFRVVTAADGVEGVEFCTRELPDVVLMDLHMPVMDGWAATRAIRANEATAQIPVLILTAYNSSRDRSAAMDAGASDFDSKPISMPRLIAKMERLLGLEPSEE
ncbi:MAG: CheY-like chemotaxis protein [Bradymonadia bacterium]|jgi:CheY-like chemotaxis protein